MWSELRAVAIAQACPLCASEHVIKVGKRSGYQCKTCEKKFHANGNASGKRFTANQMGAAVRMFCSGMSYKQVAEKYDVPVPSKATIYGWVRDYTDSALRSTPAGAPTARFSRPPIHHAGYGGLFFVATNQTPQGASKGRSEFILFAILVTTPVAKSAPAANRIRTNLNR